MKLFEVLRKDLTPLSERELVARLRDFDWKYEFSNNSRVQAKGQRELELLENQVYQLWKQEPEKAVALWHAHCPWAAKGTTPSFIMRLEAQE
jgi:hypothetical protein